MGGAYSTTSPEVQSDADFALYPRTVNGAVCRILVVDRYSAKYSGTKPNYTRWISEGPGEFLPHG